MGRHGSGLVVAILLSLGPVSGREAAAQLMRALGDGNAVRGVAGMPAAGATTSPATPGLYANPYTNPYANPFLNPYMAQYPMTSSNAAFFFIASQQANGGIGSGQLSGVRPARPTPGGTSPAPAVDRRMQATDGASRYFNRSAPSQGGLDNYYNRQGSYFRKNVR